MGTGVYSYFAGWRVGSYGEELFDNVGMNAFRYCQVMVFNATFSNSSVTNISWRSVLLLEETGVPGENL